MRKKTGAATVALCILLLAIFAVSACDNSTPESTVLGTPTVRIEGSLALWDAVPGAVGYEIDTGADVVSVGHRVTSYELSAGMTVRVRATGDGTVYKTGEWSTPVTEGVHIHTDADSDEICDTCSLTVVVTVDIYAINDLHGKFCDTNTQPGVDELATYLDNAKETDDYAVILSTGDMWQGSAESNLTGGAIMTEWMNELGFAAMTLGNHEFDWGEDFIRENLSIAEFPFLAINVYDNSTNKLADYCTPSVLIELGGVEIGVIGAIGDCYSSISSDMVEGVHFKTGDELSALVSAEAERLEGLGADFIIYSIHDGHTSNSTGTKTVRTSSLSAYYQSKLSSSVDMVFEAHTHKYYVLRDDTGTYHLQGGGENYGITHAEIKINGITGDFTVNTAEVIKSSVWENLDDHEKTEALEDKYNDVINRSYDTLGTASSEYSSSAIADIVAKLYLDAGLERWGEQYDITLGGGFIVPRSPYKLTAGEKCYADLLSLFPFNNRLTLCSVSGDKLLSQFIENDSSDYHIALSQYGESIKGNISKSGTYYVVVDTYTQLYKPNGLTLIAYLDDTTFARDLLAEHIKAGNLGTKTEGYTLTSIAELLSICEGLAANTESSERYYVRGFVSDTPNTSYGDFTLTDGNGHSIYVYGLYSTDGKRYGAMGTTLSVGDEVVIYAPLYRYVNAGNSSSSKLELLRAQLIEVIE
ncbi:MAG: bifunctional metallophosphatase/5'-nucleotidase [Clostridia bacterium]|nr:bifunctional metallophosphatase/5'-nucleotidase [Clostridia bacterium]